MKNEQRLKIESARREYLLKEINSEEQYYLSVSEGKIKEGLFRSLNRTYSKLYKLREELKYVESIIIGLQLDGLFDNPDLLQKVFSESTKNIKLSDWMLKTN